MSASGVTGPLGLDLDRLAAWLPSVVPVTGDLTAQLVPGGKSNLTYLVSDGTTSWVVRRPPLGHVLATAHDMGREFRVMSALHDTAVPVPATYALCADDAVLGAPFYLMAYVDGRTYRWADDLSAIGPDRTRSVSGALVDTLAALHRIDPAGVGLSELGHPDGFLSRQVRRWRKQLDASHSRELPDADALYERLLAEVPPASAPAIVHGDYRLDNVLVAADDRIAAVIDWEMATIGDPLTDLALMVLYARLPEMARDAGLAPEAGIADATTAAGYLSEAEVIARYTVRRGQDLPGLGFYLALAAFKLAAVLEGIHYRHLQGLTVGTGFAGIGAMTPALLAAGRSALKERP